MSAISRRSNKLNDRGSLVPNDFTERQGLAEVFAHQDKPCAIVQFTMPYVKVTALAYQFQVAGMVRSLIYTDE